MSLDPTLAAELGDVADELLAVVYDRETPLVFRKKVAAALVAMQELVPAVVATHAEALFELVVAQGEALDPRDEPVPPRGWSPARDR